MKVSKAFTKTEVRNKAANYLIGILQNLEPAMSFENVEEEELIEINKEVKRYAERLITHLIRIRNDELKRGK